MLQQDEITRIEDLLVEFHDTFAKHRFDIGMNEELKVILPLNDNSSAYSQNLPTSIILKEDFLVELAFLHRYGIITTIPLSKYGSPMFARKKPNGKLRLLVDLQKFNNLISDDYIHNNHSVSTLTDAAENMAGKKFFCKLDCSQAYHTVCKWPTDGLLNCLHLNSPAERSPIANWHKVSVVPFQFFLASYANI